MHDGRSEAVRRTCGCDGEDAVGVNVELDLDLGDAAGGGRDAVQAEVAQRLVIPHKLTLACTQACAASVSLLTRELRLRHSIQLKVDTRTGQRSQCFALCPFSRCSMCSITFVL